MPGLSASTITNLKKVCEDEFREWNRRSLAGKEYVYVWADGVHFNIRLEEDRQCILVLMGATAEGKKELIAVHDGYRESEQPWKELLLDEKPVGSRSNGKTANVLDKLPKRIQPNAKDMIHQVWMAETRKHADEAFDLFLKTYEAK